MHELEFLPEWYQRLLARRRMLLLHIWIALLVAASLLLWSALARRNLGNSEAALGSLSAQLRQMDSQLQQMDRLEALKRQMRRQAEVLARLGVHVGASRIIAMLSEAAPSSVAFTSLRLELEEKAVPVSGLMRAAAREPGATPPPERRLRATLRGVAPTDVELATLLSELSRLSFIEGVAPTAVKDSRRQGHVMREFELTFSIRLGTAVEAAAGI
jgi:Tfp pilus assembly protein PilN